MPESTIPGAGPTTVSEANYERVFHPVGADGFLGTTADSSIVYGDSTGRHCKVRAGKFALLRGSRWASGDDDLTLAIAANASGQTRYDRAVLRFDRATWLCSMEIITGTPGAGPPAPLADEGPTGFYDLRAAKIKVINGATTIGAADVEREDAYVGEPPIVYTSVTRPETARFNQLGLCTDLPASAAVGAPTGRWEWFNGTSWLTLTPPVVNDSVRWGGYRLTVASSTPSGTPDADRIWIQPI